MGGAPDVYEVALRNALKLGADQSLGTCSWPQLLVIARRERLEAVLWRLADAGDVSPSPEHLDALRDALRARGFSVARLLGHQIRITTVLAERSIRPVILKGPASAALDHPRPTERHYVDLDLLVPRAAFDSASQAIEDLGGQRQEVELRSRFDARFAKSVTFRMGDGAEVDLHLTIAPDPMGAGISADDLLTDLEEYRIGRHTFYALSREQRFIHSCIHAVLGVDRRVVPLLDARLQVDVADPAAVADAAARWRVGAVVARAVMELVDRWGLPPEHPLASWATGYVPTRFERLVLDTTADVVPSQAMRSALTLVAMNGIVDRLEYARGFLWPSKAYLRATGSSRLDWLTRATDVLRRRLGRRQP